MITVGELCCRKRQTNTGEMFRLQIRAWRVQKGEPALASVPAAMDATPEWSDEQVATPKARSKPQYPKWRSESAN